MNVRHCRWAFGAVVGLFLGLLFWISVFDSELIPTTVGVSAGWTNGGYQYGGGTAPWLLGFAVMVLALYVLLMEATPIGPGTPFPSVLRRLAAFWLDFIVAMSIVTAPLGLLAVILERRRTGVFQWSFERETYATGDLAVAGFSVFACFAFLLFYYAVPVARRRPSPGACILGYQVLPDDAERLTFRKAILRTLLGFLAVAAAPIALFVARRQKEGKFWLDAVFHTRATYLS
jgi:RDD family